MPAPPRIARAWLALLLPADARAAVLGELDHEYRAYIVPARGRIHAHLWYWRQVLWSTPAALAMRQRRRRKRTMHSDIDQRAPVRQVVEQTMQDVRFGVRFLRKRPGFAAAAIATFAIGIGANIAIFSIVDAVVLRPLPYPEPERLIRIWSANPRGIARNLMSPPNFFDFRDRATGPQAFDVLAAFTGGDASTLHGRGEPQRVVTSTVSPTLFSALGVRPLLGRTFHPNDAEESSVGTAVIGHTLWQRHFAGSHDAVGSSISLDASTYIVIGVMPPAFQFPSRSVELWVPLRESLRSRSRSGNYLDVIGRLSPGVPLDGAVNVLRSVAMRLESQYPGLKGWGITATTLHESLVGSVRTPLLVLLGSVGCVLLIACANVTSLLLARGIAREREIAVRTALGASRWRIARQQFVESMAIAALGGAAALVVARIGLDLLRAQSAYELPRAADIALDGRVLAAAVLLSILTGVLTGLAPAWRAARLAPNDSLKSGRASGGGLSAQRSRSVLVIAEIAITLALLIWAGLLGRSLLRLTGVDAGFRADDTLVAQVSLPVSRYEPEVWSSFFSRALDEIRALPGVTAAGAGSPLPLSGGQGLMRFGVRFEGRPDPAEGQNDRAYLRWATPDYFRAIGIPLLHGRAFNEGDGADTNRVAVVDSTFVQRYFPGTNPIGQRVRPTNERAFREIVGVVGAVRPWRLEDPPEPHLYVPQSQNPSPAMTFVIRADPTPSALAPSVREAIRRIDPEQPIFNVGTLEGLVAGSVAARRFNVLLIAVFADAALLLMIVGIYGLIAGWVTESTRDIGVRLALGATAREIFRFVVGRGVRLAACGAMCGVILAFAGSRLLAGMLYGIVPWDPIVFSIATLLVACAAAAASYLPARRAISVDPVVALRAE